MIHNFFTRFSIVFDIIYTPGNYQVRKFPPLQRESLRGCCRMAALSWKSFLIEDGPSDQGMEHSLFIGDSYLSFTEEDARHSVRFTITNERVPGGRSYRYVFIDKLGRKHHDCNTAWIFEGHLKLPGGSTNPFIKVRGNYETLRRSGKLDILSSNNGW